MPDIKDRNMFRQNTCYSCKHCWPLKIIDEHGYSDWEYFCLLGVSREDKINILNHEISSQWGLVYEDWSDYSEEFIKLMRIDPEGPWCPGESDRYVEPTDCCQFHEPYTRLNGGERE